MGGPLFLQAQFFSFHYEWGRILSLHNTTPPIHMKEFGKHGRFGYLNHNERRALFGDLVSLINRNKVYSLTVAVDNLEFQEFFPQGKYKGLIGAAPLAFLWCLILNHSAVRDHERLGRVAYVVSKSDFNPEVTDCHAFWGSFEERIKRLHSGSLTFDTPSEVNALQAADMIAWANRKKQLGEPFKSGFEPLELLTRYVESTVKPVIHFHYPATREGTQKLADILGSPVRNPGRRLSLLGRVPLD